MVFGLHLCVTLVCLICSVCLCCEFGVVGCLLILLGYIACFRAWFVCLLRILWFACCIVLCFRIG